MTDKSLTAGQALDALIAGKTIIEEDGSALKPSILDKRNNAALWIYVANAPYTLKPQTMTYLEVCVAYVEGRMCWLNGWRIISGGRLLHKNDSQQRAISQEDKDSTEWTVK